MSDVTKICVECKIAHPFDNFYLTSSKYGTLNSRCKKCFIAYSNGRDRNGLTRIQNYQGPETIKNEAIRTLQVMGYDTSKEIHPQFMVRFNKWISNRSSKT